MTDTPLSVEEQVAHEEAREAASRLIASAFRREEEKRARFTIPARPDDDDLLIMRYIKQQEALATARREEGPELPTIEAAADYIISLAHLRRAVGDREPLHRRTLIGIIDRVVRDAVSTARRAPELAEGEVERLIEELQPDSPYRWTPLIQQRVRTALARQQAEIANLIHDIKRAQANLASEREVRVKAEEKQVAIGKQFSRRAEELEATADALKRAMEEIRKDVHKGTKGDDWSALLTLASIKAIADQALTAAKGEGEGLKQPVRKFEDTFSAETVVMDTYFPSSEAHSAGEGGERIVAGQRIIGMPVSSAYWFPAAIAKLREECAASGHHGHDGCDCSDMELWNRSVEAADRERAATLRPDLLREAMEALEAAAIRFRLLAINRLRTDIDPAVGAKEVRSILDKLKTEEK